MFALGNFVEIRIIPACFCLAFKHYISRAYELETNMCIMTLSTAPAPPLAHSGSIRGGLALRCPNSIIAPLPNNGINQDPVAGGLYSFQLTAPLDGCDASQESSVVKIDKFPHTRSPLQSPIEFMIFQHFVLLLLPLPLSNGRD